MQQYILRFNKGDENNEKVEELPSDFKTLD